MKRYFNAYIQPKKDSLASTIRKEFLQITMGNRKFSGILGKRHKGNLERYMQMTNKHMKGTQLD